MDIEETIGMKIMKRGRSRSRERQYPGNVRRNGISSRLRSGSRVSNNRVRVSCYKCREYDHFTKDCPITKTEKGNRSNTANV